MIDLDELECLWKATTGPEKWVVADAFDHETGTHFPVPNFDQDGEDNLWFLAEVRNAFPALLAELRAARGRSVPGFPQWQSGRQGTGYRKLALAQGKTWDAWLLDYPPGTSIPPHKDPVAGREHWRLNIVLRSGLANMGYEREPFHSTVPLNIFGRVVLFRSDLVKHWVGIVTKRRVVLSIGWIR